MAYCYTEKPGMCGDLGWVGVACSLLSQWNIDENKRNRASNVEKRYAYVECILLFQKMCLVRQRVER